MSDKQITCTECEADFQVIHDGLDEPEYCPFCSAPLFEEEYEEEYEEEWEDSED